MRSINLWVVLCVWVCHMYVWMWVGEPVSVGSCACVCVWRGGMVNMWCPEVNVRSLPQSLSTLFHETRSLSKPRLAYWATSHAYLLLSPWTQVLGLQIHTTPIFYVHVKEPNPGSHACPASASTAKSSPRLRYWSYWAHIPRNPAVSQARYLIVLAWWNEAGRTAAKHHIAYRNRASWKAIVFELI